MVRVTLRMCSCGLGFPGLLSLIVSVALFAGLVFPAASCSQARIVYLPYWPGAKPNDKPGLVSVEVQTPVVSQAIQLVAVSGAMSAGAPSVIV